MDRARVCVVVLAALLLGGLSELGAAPITVTVSSTDVPHTFVDNDPTGFTSVLIGPNMILTDVNFIFNDLRHTSVPDIHLELTAPSGVTQTLLRAFTEGGILVGLGTPDDFVGTVFDDEALTNLRDGVAPYTGSYNIEHSSVVTMPLSTFDGELALGTWTLFASDLAVADVGRLNAWSLEFTGELIPEPASLSLLGLGLLAVARRRRKR